MPIRKTVRRGDSLWSLACRYLGSGDRYPQIYNFHNLEAGRYGLQPIESQDLIFVGQTILIPPRTKSPKPGNGTKAEGGRWPIALSLKVTYTIGRDTLPIIYAATYGDYSIKTEMSGEIGIENTTPGHFRYVHNYELAMSQDPLQVKQKLRDTTDPALVALTAKPEMVFESGRVKIKAPIAAKANIGAYEFELKHDNPIQMSGTLKPPTISGELEMGRRKYKYSADIELKVEVTLHPRSVGRKEPVKAPVKGNEPVFNEPTNSVDWQQLAKDIDDFLAVVSITILSFVPQFRMSMLNIRGTTSFMPFTHTVRPGYYGYPGNA